MADLEDLGKRLYKQGEGFEERKIPPDLARDREEHRILWQKDPKTPLDALKRKKMILWFGVFTLVFAGGIFLFFQFYGFNAFLNIQAIKVEIVGDKEVRSGDRISWQVRITNANNIAIEDAVLVFNYPEGSTSLLGQMPEGIFRSRQNLNTINPGESVTQTYNAYVFGARGSSKKVSAVLEYRPKGSSATFGKDASFVLNIVRSPVTIAFNIPENLRIGQTMEFEIRYNSQSDKDLSNLSVELLMPEGFQYESADPPPSADNSKKFGAAKTLGWYIGSLRPAQDGVIKVKGKISGSELEVQNFQASLGVMLPDKVTISAYDSAVAPIVLHSPFLAISILAKGQKAYITFPGDLISFEISWKNNLPVSVSEAILEMRLDSLPVDMRSLRVMEGFFRDSTKSLVWNASSHPDFKSIPPGASGKVQFDFKTKSSFPLESGEGRPVIKLAPTFKSNNVIAGFEGVDTGGRAEMEIKVSSKLQLSARAVYFDAPIPNTGPMPPKVGSETTYTITWSLANMVNDVDNVTVTSSLPPYMNFKNVFIPANSALVYDQNTGELQWKLGRVPAGTGFLSPAMQVSFQVGIVPGEDQVNFSPIIINDAKATGKDNFTGVDISATAPKKTTDIQDDPRAGFNQRRVAP
ncbi:MAG: hypothetical protein Q8P07_03375 [bacterium]|nr:hypothetical protein [bacterium]